MLKYVLTHNPFFDSFLLVPSAKYDTDANKYWDRFYEMHHGKFFRNRSWLFTEFPELLPQDVGIIRTPEKRQGNVCSDAEDGVKQQPCGPSLPTCDSYPGQHADFRILEVLKTTCHFFCWQKK